MKHLCHLQLGREIDSVYFYVSTSLCEFYIVAINVIHFNNILLITKYEVHSESKICLTVKAVLLKTPHVILSHFPVVSSTYLPAQYPNLGTFYKI